MRSRLNVNGNSRAINVESDKSLLWTIREQFALTGTTYAYGIARCGACTAHLDGKPVRSRVTFFSVAPMAGKGVSP